MSNWFKKLFGCKCHCEQGHCSSCSKEEEKKPVENTPTPTPVATPEVTKKENVEKVQ